MKFAAAALLLCLGAPGLWAFQDDDEDEDFDRPFDRWDYFYQPRVFPRAQLPEGARLQAFREWGRMEGLKPRAATQNQWKSIGPQPVIFFGNYVVSGRINSI